MSQEVHRELRRHVAAGTDPPPLIVLPETARLACVVRRGGLAFCLIPAVGSSPSPALAVAWLSSLAARARDVLGGLDEARCRSGAETLHALIERSCDGGIPLQGSSVGEAGGWGEGWAEGWEGELAGGAAAAAAAAATAAGSAGWAGLAGAAAGAAAAGLAGAAVRAAPGAASRPLGGGTVDAAGAPTSSPRAGAAGGATSPGGAAPGGEVFVDVVERLSVHLSGTGAVETSFVDGAVHVKSFLRASDAWSGGAAAGGDAVTGGGAGAGGSGAPARGPSLVLGLPTTLRVRSWGDPAPGPGEEECVRLDDAVTGGGAEPMLAVPTGGKGRGAAPPPRPAPALRRAPATSASPSRPARLLPCSIAARRAARPRSRRALSPGRPRPDQPRAEAHRPALSRRPSL